MSLQHGYVPELPPLDALLEHYLPYARARVAQAEIAKLELEVQLTPPLTSDEQVRLDDCTRAVYLAGVGLNQVLKSIKVHHQNMR